jgi:hypothetical protein
MLTTWSSITAVIAGFFTMTYGHRVGYGGLTSLPKMSSEPIEVAPVDEWGRRPFFQAKVGTMGSALVLVKGARRIGPTFSVGERIEFCEWGDLQGCSLSMAPRWHTGIVWKIEDNRLFIERH